MKPYAITWHDGVAKHRAKDTEAEAREDAERVSAKKDVRVLVLKLEHEQDGSRAAHPIAMYVDGKDARVVFKPFEVVSKKHLDPFPEYAAVSECDPVASAGRHPQYPDQPRDAGPAGERHSPGEAASGRRYHDAVPDQHNGRRARGL